MTTADKIRSEQIGADHTFTIPELQERADRNPLDQHRQQYRLWRGDQEVAFVTFDIFWPNELNMYEVFVAAPYRGQGIGAEIIRFAIEFIKQLGKPRLTVRARPLSDQSQESLINWYLRQGLTTVPGETELLEFKVE